MQKSDRHATNPPSTAPRAGALRAASAVAWGFFGVRKNNGHAGDIAQISPVQIVVAGLVGAGLFIGTLLTVVALVV